MVKIRRSKTDKKVEKENTAFYDNNIIPTSEIDKSDD